MIEPYRLRMRDSGVDEDSVTRAGIELCSVPGINSDMAVVLQVLFGAGRQVGIYFDRRNAPACPHDLRQNRRVVAGAAAQMKDAFSFLEMKRVDPMRQRARLTVVEMAFRVERHQHVVIKVLRIFRGDIAFFTRRHVGRSNLPGRRPDKVFSRHARKSLDQRRSVQAGGDSNFFRVETAAVFDCHNDIDTVCTGRIFPFFMRFKVFVGSFFILYTFMPPMSAASVTQYSDLFAFGDSLSDTGNASILSGGLLPGSNYAPGRYTDGPNTTPATTGPTGLWVEQLAAKLGVADPLPALAGGTNYAVAGASTGSSNPQDITNQVNAFLAGHLLGASPTALYTIWGGANDFFNGTSVSAGKVADNLYANIQTLAGSGAKNFLWVDLPPLGLTPRGGSNSATLEQEVMDFNGEWAIDIAKLQSQGINVTGVDVYSLFQQLVQNPGAYGFTNITDPAQGLSGVNPNNYLFWDQEHPTTAGHALIADLAYNDLTASPVPEPMSLAFTALGLGALLTAARVRRSRQNAEHRSRSSF